MNYTTNILNQKNIYLAGQLKGNKELSTSFSVFLELEKENQAILSSDQTKYLQEWWGKLNPKLKKAIENQSARIIIEGYTSHTGGHDYNLILGNERAEYVKDMLNMIIGKRQNTPIAIIDTKSNGEIKESKRYVKITVIPN